jgi:plastocyanin
MHRLAIAATTLAFGALGLAACGGGGGNEEASTTTTTTETAQKSIAISETEYKLDPSTVNVDKAGTYTVEVTNDGSVTHALEVEGNGMEEQKTGDIAPGESKSITVDLKAGTYEMYCPISGHKKLGMEGEITVGGSATPTTTTDTSSSGYGG